MTKPLFSIIIPVYNTAPYLRDCLDSIFNQTFTDWECICVDDGSTDNSSHILDEYQQKDKRFKVIHQKNTGVSVARNKGLDMASGKWVSFVDADDIIELGYFTEFINWEEKGDINFFNMHSIGDTNNSDPFYQASRCLKIEDYGSLLFDRALGSNIDAFGWTWNKFILGDIAKRIRFNTNLDYFEDEVYTLEICDQCTTFSFLPSTLYGYRRHNAGLTKGKDHNYGLVSQCFEEVEMFLKSKYLRDIARKRADFFFNLQAKRTGSFRDYLNFARHRNQTFFSILRPYMNWQIHNASIFKLPRKLYRYLMQHGEYAK